MIGNGPDAIGILNLMNFTFRRSWIYMPGKIVQNRGKYTSSRDQIYLDGGTPQQVISQSKKLTIYKKITMRNQGTVFGERSGIQDSR